MLINDFSQQDFLTKNHPSKYLYLELITAGAIFIAPILFLIFVSS